MKFCSKQKSGSHVIFLGAGASVTSGYPVGNELRLRLSSEKRFTDELMDATGFDQHHAHLHSLKLFNDCRDAINLFRHGGFATVDEFSKLASRENGYMVQQMKTLLRFALAFHNPEDEFASSDYYAFIQHLFDDADLHCLKGNITILSYNYDCYLDYLLLRACRKRQSLAKATGQPQAAKHFQLHGSVAGNNADFLYPLLFKANAEERIKGLAEDGYRLFPPPIVFPWEVFNGSGEFISQEDFILVKSLRPQQSSAEAIACYKSYKRVWEEARRAVQGARKISFVGLSAHPYMETGLKYLFAGKAGTVEVVVANKANGLFKESKAGLHPASLCGKVSALLERVAPELKFVRSSSEDDGIIRFDDFDLDNKTWQPGITPRYTFSEFIETEMD